MTRRALEAFALGEYKRGQNNKLELRRVLGHASRDQLDSFLKDHCVDESFTLEEVEQQVEGLKQLGF